MMHLTKDPCLVIAKVVSIKAFHDYKEFVASIGMWQSHGDAVLQIFASCT